MIASLELKLQSDDGSKILKTESLQITVLGRRHPLDGIEPQKLGDITPEEARIILGVFNKLSEDLLRTLFAVPIHGAGPGMVRVPASAAGQFVEVVVKEQTVAPKGREFIAANCLTEDASN